MFEHREGHPTPPGAGTVSRLPRGHGSLALYSIDHTHRCDRFAARKHRNATTRSTAAGPPMFEHREGHPAPPGAGTASRSPRGHGSLALPITIATVWDDARHRNATARSTAARPPMFEHREGHSAPPGAGTASRSPRSHGSLALYSIDHTHQCDRLLLLMRAIDIEINKCDYALDCGQTVGV
jgi:hypothetical protein